VFSFGTSHTNVDLISIIYIVQSGIGAQRFCLDEVIGLEAEYLNDHSMFKRFMTDRGSWLCSDATCDAASSLAGSDFDDKSDSCLRSSEFSSYADNYRFAMLANEDAYPTNYLFTNIIVRFGPNHDFNLDSS
jgi:hypothetical protein